MPVYVQPGATFEAAAQNLIPNLEGTVRAGIWDQPAGGTAVYGPSTAGIVEDPEGSGFYGKSDFEAPATGGQYWIKWDSGEDTAVAVDPLLVAYTNPDAITGPTFATPWDVAARLGVDVSSFTTEELTQIDYLLAAGADAILDAIGKDAEWAVGPDVPTYLRYFLTDLVVRALSAPVGTDSVTETLGQHSYTSRYSEGGGGFWLTEYERRWLRKRFGLSSGSVRVESFADDLVPTVVVE